MEKPELEKILKKLEKLDTNQWEWQNKYYGSTFIARVGCLTFYLSIERDYDTLIKERHYHSLCIKNDDGSIRIEYPNKKSKDSKEIEIKNFYEKLRSSLKESREKRFEQSLNEFLSE